MDQKLSLGNTGVTDYLIVRCRKVSDAGAEVSHQVFGPSPPTTQNMVFTGLDPDYYFFDVYESTDGTALSSLFNTFEINVADGTITRIYKYYLVGRGGTGDPNAGDTVLDDPYLDGKTISSLEQRGIGKLRPTDEWTRTSTGVALVSPLSFSDQDTYTIEIELPTPIGTVSNAGPFNAEVDITGSLTLDSTYYNKTLNCNAAGTQLIITLDHVATVPALTQFKFIDQEGGAQFQTKIVPQSGELIKWRGLNMSEIWLGKGEFLVLKKRSTYWKVVDAHSGLNMVGLRFSGQYKSHPNTAPEDGTLCTADDYPREYWFANSLPSNLKIIDDNLDNVGYTRPTDKQGQYIISTTKRKFRRPDTRGLSEKGLKDFITYGTDTDRDFDYPGGHQDGNPGEVSMSFPKGDGYTGHTPTAGRFAPGQAGNPQGTDFITVNVGKKTTSENIGVIYLRCI